MPVDPIQIGIDVIKITVSAAIGFFAGRHQARSGQKAARIRDCQQNVIKLTRALVVDSVKFFSMPMKREERIAATTLLKASLKTISTDVGYLAAQTGNKVDIYLHEYTLLFDSVTKYPFETFGEIHFQVHQIRADEITLAGEGFVAKMYMLCDGN
jgi:hypothetical protein